MDAVHDRRGEREDAADEVLHLLRDPLAGHAVLHERLVDVEVEEPHLGVGHLRERVAVDPQQLQQRDAREPGLGRARDVGEQHDVVRREPRLAPGADREAHRREGLGQRTRARGRPPRRPRRGRPRDRGCRAGARSRRTPARRAASASRIWDGTVPARLQARDEPGLRGDLGRPRAAEAREQAVADPRPERLRRDPRPARDLVLGQRVHVPQHDDGGAHRSPPSCGQCGPLPRPWGARRQQMVTTAPGRRREPPTLRPFAVFRYVQKYSHAPTLSSAWEVRGR